MRYDVDKGHLIEKDGAGTSLQLLVTCIWLSVFAGSATAQPLQQPSPRYPRLAPSASSAKGFVPSGWRLEAQAEGDLDEDGTADLAMVLRGTDPALVVRNEGLGDPEFDTNPRILAVALSRGGQYELVVQNHTLIPRREDPVVEDPFEESGIEIQRRTLRVRLSFFMSAGGWETSTSTFTFRTYGGRQLRLIGFSRDTRQRNTGAISAVSANFLTGRARVETAPHDEAKRRTLWKSIPTHLLPIEKISNGLEFRVKGES